MKLAHLPVIENPIIVSIEGKDVRAWGQDPADPAGDEAQHSRQQEIRYDYETESVAREGDPTPPTGSGQASSPQSFGLSEAVENLAQLSAERGDASSELAVQALRLVASEIQDIRDRSDRVQTCLRNDRIHLDQAMDCLARLTLYFSLFSPSSFGLGSQASPSTEENYSAKGVA